jgi:hypothetical protein
MPREIAIFSVLMPTLLLVVIGVSFIFVAIDLLLSRLGLFRFVWHPALFRAALYVLICSAAALTLGFGAN